MQSTIGVGQIDDCVACLRWLNHHAGDSAVLIVEQRFYAWALNFLDQRIAIAWYPHDYPIDLVPIASVLEEHEETYLIWPPRNGRYISPIYKLRLICHQHGVHQNFLAKVL